MVTAWLGKKYGTQSDAKVRWERGEKTEARSPTCSHVLQPIFNFFLVFAIENQKKENQEV